MSYKWSVGVVVGLLFTLAVSNGVFAQSEDKPQQEETSEGEDPVLVRAKHQAKLSIGGSRSPRNSAPRIGGAGKNRQLKDGGETQTVTDRQGRRTIIMRVNQQQGVLVEVAIDYGPENKAELIRKHPELADYVELFPQQVGEHQVELSLKIRSQYRAQSPEELKTKHPNAFNLLRRYYKNDQR